MKIRCGSNSYFINIISYFIPGWRQRINTITSHNVTVTEREHIHAIVTCTKIKQPILHADHTGGVGLLECEMPYIRTCAHTVN